MKTNNKRSPKLLSLFLALCMVLSLLPMAALAAETDIPIDEEHFPKKHFYNGVLEGFDTDKNGMLSLEERSAVSELDLINIQNQEDWNLLGYFPNLTKLSANGEFTSVDLSKCPKLESLSVNTTAAELDFSTCPTLKSLYIPDGSALASINLSSNKDLTHLKIMNCSKLNDLDLSQCTALEVLDCAFSSVRNVNLSNNLNMKEMVFGSTRLEKLDLSQVPNLTRLHLYQTAIGNMDLSLVPKLTRLFLLGTSRGNNVNNLDLSHNPDLETLDVNWTDVAHLDLSHNPNLSKINVGNNCYTISQRENFDCSTLPGNFDVSKVSNVVGGKFDTANNTFSFDNGSNEATYEYDTGYTGNGTMNIGPFKLVYKESTPPAPTEPQPTEPKPTEPKPTEPKPTEPKPTEPPHTHKFGEWVVTKEPTSTTEGIETRTCSCGETETRSIPKLTSNFTDISSKDYYYEPVLWAVNKGITAGVSENQFGPKLSCTRGQIATFLWASAGKPEPTSTNNPFTDVKKSDYYYKAVLWAVENGITAGVSANRFGPNQVCTRAQTVTFLWAAEGKPTISSNTSFSDVSASAYYNNAVKWAVANGVTAGVGNGKFAPNQTCTRGQIVTFLYKAVG